ncbi:hypothetical protein FACS1894105_09870 [Clostridia bacterium]|nr:hypothetical protein FACS1894105_09870 [Clostridia bacterium]
MKLLEGEFYKAKKNRQLGFIVLFFILYILTTPYLNANPEYFNGVGVSLMLDAVAGDHAMFLIFSGLIMSAVFTCEYQHKTLKNYLTRFSKKEFFLTKVFFIVLCAFILVVVLALVGFVYACIYSGGTPTTDDILFYFYRNFGQFCMAMFHLGLLLLIGVISRNSIVVNIATLALTLVYALVPIPFNSELTPIYKAFELSYSWGAVPDRFLCLFFIITFIVLAFLSGLIFERQEVRT